MGMMGLALAWQTRIHPVAQRERRVEPFGKQAAAPDSVAETMRAEDFALATACQSGDLHAYERLYSLHGARMKNLARNILGSSMDAEDAVQETFLKVQRSVGSFRGQSSFVTWTFRVLVNTCYDARRSRLRKKEVATDDEREDTAPRPEPRAASAHPTLRLALERALAKLTRHQRDVFRREVAPRNQHRVQSPPIAQSLGIGPHGHHVPRRVGLAHPRQRVHRQRHEP